MGQLGHQVQRLWGDLDGFLLGNPAQVLFQGLQRDAAEIKALAAAQDRGEHPLGIGGGQHKHHPRWWLLEGFEQGVEGRGGEHVAFIHHIDLPARLHRCKARALNQIADVVDTGVGGGIDLDDIQGTTGCDRGAELAVPAGFCCGPVTAEAIE